MQKSAPVRAQALPFYRFPARPPATLLIAAVILAAVILAGCTTRAPLGGGGNAGAGKAGQSAAAGTRQQTKEVQFSDIPVPRGRKINVDKTVVVGTDVWYGQLTYDTGHSAEAMFDFYNRELPGYGWRKITSVRAHTSIMTYDRQNRVMTVAITPNRILGSEVMISVSPREQSSSPPPAAAPSGRAPPVMSRPLVPAPPASLNPPPQPRLR